MTFYKQASLALLGAALLSARCQTCSAQLYGPSLGPTLPPIPSVPELVPSPLRPFQGGQSLFAPFPSSESLVPAPVFEEPPAELLPSSTPGEAPPLLSAPQSFSVETPPNAITPSTRPHFQLGGVVQADYDSNLFIQQTHAQSDVYFVLAPMIAIANGSFSGPLQAQQEALLQVQSFGNADLMQTPIQPFYYLLYIPSYTAFVGRSNLNSFDNDVSGAAQIVLHRIALGAFARFQTLRSADVDVGTRIEEQWTSARAYALYTLSDRTRLEADVFLQNRQYQSFISSFEVWNEDWLDYMYSTKTSLGAGTAAGLVIPSAGPQEDYGRLQARATWSASMKISLAAKAGLELRAVNARGSRLYPVFGLEGRYAVSSRTLLTLSAYQQVQSSADQEALVYLSRGLNLSLEQKLLDQYILTAGAGYSYTEYDDAFARIPGGYARNDNFIFANLNLQVKFNRWVDSQAGIEFRKNDSSRAGSSFNEGLATWALRFRF